MVTAARSTLRRMDKNVEETATEVAVRFLEAKAIPTEANYRPANSRKRCGTCTHFEAGHCDRWEEDVDVDWTCDSWEAGPG